MAFPDVIVECAFDNDINEYLYAQAGYSDITQFVKSISGDLRGRRYEMDTVEAGSLSVTLDNSDGRFTPKSQDSPYYPFVKPARRFRVRGKNLQRNQIATAGSTLRSAEGFSRDTYPSHVSAYPADPVVVETKVAGVSPLVTKRTNLSTNPELATVADGVNSNNGTLYPVAWVDGQAVSTRTSASQPGTPVASVYITGRTGVTSQPATAGQPYAFSVDVTASTDSRQASSYLQFRDAASHVVGSSTVNTVDLATNSPTRVGAIGTAPANTASVLMILTVSAVSATDTTGETVSFDNVLVENSDVIGTMISGDMDARLNADGTASDYRWTGAVGASTSEELTHPIGAGTHHIEVTVPAGAPAAAHGLVQFNVPLETGRRLNHSIYIWRVSGTEPTGTMGVSFVYYDADGNALSPFPGNGWTLPSPSTPTRRYSYGGHTPPPTAASCTAVVVVTATATFTSDVTYAFDAIQTEDTPNLAPNPTGRWDAKDWYVTGDNDTTPTNGPMWVQMVASAEGTDSEFYTLVSGLIPGEDYTAYIEVEHEEAGGGTPTTNLQITADDGQTVTVVGGKAVYESAVYTFTATATTQKLAVQMEGGDFFDAGHVIKAKYLNVQPGDTSPGRYGEESDDDVTAWEHPKPIFEGWVENWPIRVSSESPEVTVVVNDRLKRIGDITLDSTWREAVFADKMELIVPFDDDPIDASGMVAQVGTWASSDQFINLDILATKGDIGASNYVLGVDGPGSPTAIDLNPVGSSQGYFFPVPYSKDYTAPAAPPPPPPPAPKPPPPPPTYTTYTYTKKYYATWSRSFDGDSSTTWDDSAYLYQGYFSGDRGLTRSLVGFNYKAIMADLSGATIKYCYFTAKNEHWYYNGGGTAYLGTHSYSSKPGSWSGGSVHENRWHYHWDEGDSRTVSLGVTAGNEFKSGASRGVSFGPPPYGLTYYGYFRGATLSYRPYLTINYTKTVRTS